MRRCSSLLAVAALAFFFATPVRADTTPNDTARFLAGLQPAMGSPLADMAKSREWQAHSRNFDNAFQQIEQRQLLKIRGFSAAHIPSTRGTLFYMFSGPDFLYATSFFPRAHTYVLAGLEPVGGVPDLTKLKGGVWSSLQRIGASMNTLLNYSYFITSHMQSDLHSGPITGTLPILYVFLARTGNTIHDVSLVRVAENGSVVPDTGKGANRGVKISFSGPDGAGKTLYYFSTNLEDSGVRSSGFLQFCQTLAPGDAFVKSASYLLHNSNFSRVREFLLTNAGTIVQDDTGIPLTYYDPKKWDLRPYGRYVGPIPVFSGMYQAKYATLFKQAPSIDFGIGYRWQTSQSNVLIAVKSGH